MSRWSYFIYINKRYAKILDALTRVMIYTQKRYTEIRETLSRVFNYTHKRHAEKLDYISGILFFIGIIFAKAQYLAPVPILGLISNSIGLILYLVGYFLWFIAAQISPDKRKNTEHWTGFASLRQQFTVASVIGLAATILGLAAIFMPILIVPTCWLFTVSNVWWFFGEYQKTKTPPELKNVSDYSPNRQQAYFKYVAIVLVLSVLTSALTTIAFFVPAFFLIFLILSPYLGGIGIKAYIDNFLKPNKAKDIAVQADPLDIDNACQNSVAATQRATPVKRASSTMDMMTQFVAGGLGHSPMTPSPTQVPHSRRGCGTPTHFTPGASVEVITPDHPAETVALI
ncbi:MAG: hypothetical protein NTW08_08050 [Gammaproteobacteria bacterium]|nr:hypothetical protein [Gammaproteobacteria bacterium]